MRTIALLQPPRIVFGAGSASTCVDLFVQREARKILLVTSASVLPQVQFLVDALAKAGTELSDTFLVKPEPTNAACERFLERARSQQIDAVLGIGGGSALDVAKLLAALIKSEQSVTDVFGSDLVQKRKLFLVCLPTTAGTGSEVSPNAVLLDEDEELKKAVISPHLVPDAAIIDPQLSINVPADVTAATGLDALTHCIEAFANKFSHPMLDLYALQGIRLISSNLLQAVRNGRDLEARTTLALGSLYGGLCLGPVNTAAVHALAYPLGGRFHVAHGVSNAVLLPHVLQFNISHAPERYAEIARAIGVNGESSARGCAERGVQELSALARNCGVPTRLSDLRIPRDAIPWMASAAMKVTRLLKNNVRPLTEQDAIQIYDSTW